MVFDHIEKLKREFTDKYVIVDNSRQELRRFDGLTGMIKTVNMNGRALVEFDGFENIGWYDIDLEALKVVDKPPPKEETKKAAPKKAAAKPAAKRADAPVKKAAPAGGAKMSVAEMMAAARGEKSGGAPKGEASVKSKPAESAPPAVEKSPQKLSVAEMLAAARAEKSGDAPAVASPAEAAPAPEPEPEAAAPEPEAEPDPAAEPEAPAPKGDLPTDTAGICAYCREVDGN